MPAQIVKSPLFLAFLAQVAGAGTGLVVWRYASFAFDEYSESIWLTALIAGASAAITGRLILHLSSWWILINAIFLPAVVATMTLDLPDWVFPVAFVITLAVFWNVRSERVPLYLTNQATGLALSVFLSNEYEGKTSFSFIDLGCGLSGTLRLLARQHPDHAFVGVENAPIPFLLSTIRQWIAPLENLTIVHDDIWKVDLSSFDVAYGFLSPSPMTRLYEKVTTEMRPGSIFISNSFDVVDHPAHEVITVDDRRETRLLIWRL